ncbi:MAG: GTPase HflX, partial [Firmicutes bacterium]|nr:GTPase HflX [Bacillota bacterium]
MMHNTEEKVQRFVLVAVSTGRDETDAERSLDELEDLLKTAGGEACGRVIQNLERIDNRTYVGSGKVEEIRMIIKDTEADGIICDDELTPAQLANLGELLDTKIIDRTLLILDIFTQRAATREGQMQVELAQLRYTAPRLIGKGTALSRQGGASGAIATRGPGESKLETDRRVIKRKMNAIEAE